MGFEMSDLTYEYYWICESAQNWSTKVGDYVVSYGFSHSGLYDYDYECTCKGFQFRKKCKHIEEAKKLHCNWNQFVDGGSPADSMCPRCLVKPVVSIRVGV